MSFRNHAIAIFLVGTGAVVFGGPAAAQNREACSPDAASYAFRAKKLESLQAIYATSKDPKSRCSEQVTYCTGRLLAITYRNKAAAADEAGESDQIERLMAQGRAYGAPWQLLVSEGDLDFVRGREDKAAYGRAASSYERALNELTEEPACAEFGEPGPPPRAQIAQLHKRMQEAKLLAPSFELVRTRDNHCGGVFLKNIRGFEPEGTPLPIEFEYDKATFTPKGQKAAEALKECTASSSVSRIRLSGHTDMKGPDDYNMKLSARRLETVKKFLMKNPDGYGGSIELMPRGMREPYIFDDAGQYSEEDRDQANRRVVLKDE